MKASHILLVLMISLCTFSTAVKAETLCSYPGPDLSEDLLRLTDFSVTGSSILREGDRITVKFNLQNFGQHDLNLGSEGIFVAAKDPEGEDASFGFTRANTVLRVGETVSIEASKTLDKDGNWLIWPSYHLSSATGEKFGPENWHGCSLVVLTAVRDSDKDGIADKKDNCPYKYNPKQKDKDKDGIGDLCDNCPTEYNPDQKDKNQNGIGDVCERDTTSPTVTINHYPVLDIYPTTNITFNVIATDDTNVTRIVIYVNGNATECSPIEYFWKDNYWQCTWNAGRFPAGTLTYRAEAFDPAGNRGISAEKILNVSGISPLPPRETPPGVTPELPCFISGMIYDFKYYSKTLAVKACEAEVIEGGCLPTPPYTCLPSMTRCKEGGEVYYDTNLTRIWAGEERFRMPGPMEYHIYVPCNKSYLIQPVYQPYGYGCPWQGSWRADKSNFVPATEPYAKGYDFYFEPAPETSFIIYTSNETEIHFIKPDSGIDYYIDTGMSVATPIGGENTIVFASPDLTGEFVSDSDLYLIKWDPCLGTSYTHQRSPRLFTQEGIESTPCISKDGGKIAYAKRDAIFIVDVYSAVQYGRYCSWERVAIGDYPEDPDFSPDGNKIVFESDGRIKVVDINTGEVERLTLGSPTSFHRRTPSWSPDGHYIVYSIRDDSRPLKQYDLYIMSTGMLGIGIELTDTPDYDEFRPKFSPDGGYIAYERFKAGGDSYPAEIRLIEFDVTHGTIVSDRKITEVSPPRSGWKFMYGDLSNTPAPSWFTCNQLVIFNSIVKGRVGEELTYRIPVFCGVPPYTFTLLSDLPQGLKFENGVISGVPSVPGNYTVSLEVKDSLGNSVRAEYDFRIEGPLLRVIVKDLVTESIDLDLNTLIQSGTPPYSFTFAEERVTPHGEHYKAPEGLRIDGNRLTGTLVSSKTTVWLRVEDGAGQIVWPEFTIFKPSLAREAISGGQVLFSDRMYFPGVGGSGQVVSLHVTENPDGLRYEIPLSEENIIHRSGGIGILNLSKEDVFRDINTPYETVKAKLEVKKTVHLEKREYRSGDQTAAYGEVIEESEQIFTFFTGEFLIVRDKALWYSFRFGNFGTPSLDWGLYRDLFGCGDLYHCICLDGCPCCDATRACCWHEHIPEYIFKNYYKDLAKPGNCFGMCTAAWKIRKASQGGTGDTAVGWWSDSWWHDKAIYDADLDRHVVNPVRDEPEIFGSLRRYINAMHGWQLDWDVMRHVVNQIDPLENDVGDWTRQVINTLTDNDPEEYILGITETATLGSAGHALAPYEVVKKGDVYYILCYDPNRPLNDDVMKNHGSYVKVYPGRSWEFTFPSDAPDAPGENWMNGYIVTIPKSLLKGNARFLGPDILTEWETWETLLILLFGAETEQITDERGNRLLDDKGNLITDRPTMDVMFYPSFGGNKNSSILLMGKGNYTLNLNAKDRYSYVQITPNFTLELESSAGGADILKLNLRENILEFYSPVEKNIKFVITRELPTETRITEIKNYRLKSNVTLFIEDDGIKVWSDHKTTYDILLKSEGPNATEFRHDDIKIMSNELQKVIPSANLSSITLFRDMDLNGVFESEEVLKEKILGPVAKARDINVTTEGKSAKIQLDASESYSPTNKKLIYYWKIPIHGEIVSEQPETEIEMPVGEWLGELRVSDGDREDTTLIWININIAASHPSEEFLSQYLVIGAIIGVCIMIFLALKLKKKK